MLDHQETQAARQKKRPGVKTAHRPVAKKVKSTIHLTVEASQRLDIHVAMMGTDRSSLVESLINTHLRRFVVSDRGGSAAEPVETSTVE